MDYLTSSTVLGLVGPLLSKRNKTKSSNTVPCSRSTVQLSLQGFLPLFKKKTSFKPLGFVLQHYCSGIILRPLVRSHQPPHTAPLYPCATPALYNQLFHNILFCSSCCSGPQTRGLCLFCHRLYLHCADKHTLAATLQTHGLLWWVELQTTVRS